MSRESNDGHVCPKCDTIIYREECRCTQAARNLAGYLQNSSPLVARRERLDVEFDEL